MNETDKEKAAQQKRQQQLQLKSAIEDFEDIQKLKRYAPFQRYYMRRLKAEQEIFAKTALDPDVDEDKARKARIGNQIYAWVIRLMEDDERACKSIISQAPKEEGQEPD